MNIVSLPDSALSTLARLNALEHAVRDLTLELQTLLNTITDPDATSLERKSAIANALAALRRQEGLVPPMRPREGGAS